MTNWNCSCVQELFWLNLDLIVTLLHTCRVNQCAKTFAFLNMNSENLPLVLNMSCYLEKKKNNV